jgi:hypothetical protein
MFEARTKRTAVALADALGCDSKSRYLS